MSNEAPEVLFEATDGVAEVTINRPARKNALTGPVVAELRRVFAEIDADDGIGAVVLRGAGGSFCSGLDLKEFTADPPPPWTTTFQEEWRSFHEALFALNQPVVCALEAHAINAGAAIAIGADFCIAGDDAFLQVGEVRQGRPAPMNVAWLTLKHPDAVTRRITLLGRRIPAPELARLGIVHDVVPAGDVIAAARALAAELASLPPGAAATTRRVLRDVNDRGNGESWFVRVAAAASTAARPGASFRSLKE